MGYLRWKRLGDLLGGLGLLALTAPVQCVVAVAVLLLDGPPVWFRQARVGRGGHPFTLVKFRTMRTGTERPNPTLPVRDAATDPRVTPLGRLLRRTALDELPQLWHVVRGEMSLVGPRPLPVTDLTDPRWLQEAPPTERAQWTEWLQRRHTVRPGLTGRWQVSTSPVSDLENWRTCDLAYLKAMSFREDLQLLWATPGALWRGRREDKKNIDGQGGTTSEKSTCPPGNP
jgi:lipopolysaccharide/colanic/teichoic acid biosynthesis glycosyltransferase